MKSIDNFDNHFDGEVDASAMATFDSYYPRNNTGLRECPFDANHRVKDSKYAKHVLKCEQRFPNHVRRVNASAGRQPVFASMDSIDSGLNSTSVDTNGGRGSAADTSSLTNAMSRMNVGDDDSDDLWWASDPHSSQATDTEVIADSAVEMNEESSKGSSHLYQEIESDSRTETASHSSANVSQTASQSVAKRVIEGNCLQSEDLADGEDDSAGDADDWTGGEVFDLFDPNVDYHNLTEEQLTELSETFVDPILLAAMDKSQRKRLYHKMNEMRCGHKERSVRALNELMAFKAANDPRLQSIPQEIRKPRVHIRDLFKLKDWNNKLGKTPVADQPLNDCPTTSGGEELVVEPYRTTDGQSAPSTSSAAKHCGELSAKCNSCSQSLSLSDHNVRRVTVFCGDCSSSKFGGYFECHSCRIYGYFAKSQIVDHLSRHFPETKSDSQ